MVAITVAIALFLALMLLVFPSTTVAALKFVLPPPAYTDRIVVDAPSVPEFVEIRTADAPSIQIAPAQLARVAEPTDKEKRVAEIVAEINRLYAELKMLEAQ